MTERTRLLPDQTRPMYAFDSSIARERKRRVKQFQCCLCAIFICTIVTAFVATIAYSISTTTDDSDDNSTVDAPLVLLSNTYPLNDQPEQQRVCHNESEWRSAMAEGHKALMQRDKIERNITQLQIDSPSYRHQKVVATSPRARALARVGYEEVYATRHLVGAVNKSRVARVCHNSLCAVTNSTTCSGLKFRTYNGSCNNLKNPHFGLTYRPFRRVIPPDYGDGVNQPRLSKIGKPLPSARTVSLEVHRPYYKDDDKFSVMLAVWGQFLDHDITATALSQGQNGSSIACCNQTVTHPECFPVLLDPYDPFRRYNVTCMEFVRSAPASTCCLGPREQMTQTTPFIDGSVIYGSDDQLANKLRTFKGGLLDMYVTEDNTTLLPVSKDLTDGCNRQQEISEGRYCFLTGDGRANENLHLTSMHLIWARQHNRIASRLQELNPQWSDEEVFQQTRKLVGAQMQHITYEEFLPILLGRRLMKKFDLEPLRSGFGGKYNQSVDPTIANCFATAAFRFAHSIIPGLMKLLSNDTSSPEFVLLHKMLFDPFKLYERGELDRALRGAMETSIEANDPYFTDELKHHLFENDGSNDINGDNGNKKPKQCGLDLVSLNIQRGRDHGLVGYNSWREHCGLRRARTFNQLQGEIDDDSLHNIRSVYRDVDDIDLYTGALSERPLNDGILGPTITCLILDQFVRIKQGDRFWYESPGQFTRGQLDEVRKTTLAKVICDNSDSVDRAQPRVMEKIREGNRPKSCGEIPGPSLDLWRPLHRVEMSSDMIAVKPTGH